MNNAFIIKEDVLKEDEGKDPTPALNNRAEQLTDIIEALENIAGSNYWKVLQKYVFGVELSKARKSLAKERDTTEMFRLQGDIRSLERINLETLVEKYRNELTTVKSKL